MEYKLIEEIMKRSVSDNWNQAKLEWFFEYAYQDENFQTCLCGHNPIKNICVIKNTKNDDITEVGNCCVTKFMGIDDGKKIFGSISNLKKDILKSINPEVIQYLYDKKVIDDFEFKFYLNIHRKRILSTKQKDIKLRINKKFLEFSTIESNQSISKIQKVKEWATNQPNFDTSFINSLETAFNRNGKLSEKQLAALNKIIERWKIG